MKKALLLFAFISCCIATAKSQNHQLIKKWETDSIFKVPESVLFNNATNTLYISNIDGKDPWGADGKGAISKMDADGKNIIVDWVTGLQAPKGMGIYKGQLYVADLNQVVVINIKQGVIEERITVPNAQGLNDISINKKGVVYVSDSKAKKIFTIKKGIATELLDSLKGPNGVVANGRNFYLLDAGGLYKMEKNKTLTKIADGMEGGTDGVEVINSNGDFIVSTWAGVVYYVTGDGNKQTLIDGRNTKMNSADIGIDVKNKIIFVPTFWRNSVAAYEVR